MKTNQKLNSLALRARRLLGEDSYSPIDVFAVVNGWSRYKITVVRYPFSPNISGMCTKEGEDIIIAVNSGSSYGRQRFTLAHELYHVLFDKGQTRVICDMSMGEDKPEVEREADLFASYFLMPYDALHQYAEDKECWDINGVIEAEQFYQVSHQAMLIRLQEEGEISSTDVACMQSGIIMYAAKLGYDVSLYKPSSGKKRMMVLGHYINLAEKLLQTDVISNGKYEELLLDAFRDDIVFGEETEGGDVID